MLTKPLGPAKFHKFRRMLMGENGEEDVSYIFDVVSCLADVDMNSVHGSSGSDEEMPTRPCRSPSPRAPAQHAAPSTPPRTYSQASMRAPGAPPRFSFARIHQPHQPQSPPQGDRRAVHATASKPRMQHTCDEDDASVGGSQTDMDEKHGSLQQSMKANTGR
jgi:hypothetical protein